MLVVWTVAGVIVVTLLIKYITKKKYKLPPGPPGLPFIGNVFQLDPKGPHKTITEWSEQYGDVFRIKIFGRTTVILNSFDTIYDGLVTKANQFAGRMESYRFKAILNHTPDIIVSTFSPRWAYRKKTAMQVLKSYGDNMENLELITLDLIQDTLEEMRSLSNRGPIDLYPLFHKCTTGIMTSILYGHKVEDSVIKSLLDITNRATTLLMPTGAGVLLDMMPWLRHLPIKLNKKISSEAALMKQLLSKQINARKAKYEPGQPQCFYDGLYDHKRKSEAKHAEMTLTDEEIYGMNHDLIIAGTATTSTTLNGLFAVLINKPEIQKKMVAEIERELGSRTPCLADRSSLPYVEAAILEILRYSSILTLNFPHRTTEDTTMNGYDIPKGTEVFFNLWKLHHNPEYWDEPWEFKPERFLDEDGKVVRPDHINRKRLLSFGASRRVCLGENLAKNRLFLIIVSLLQNFEFLAAGPDEIPRHDPRDYEAGVGIKPHKYQAKLINKR